MSHKDSHKKVTPDVLYRSSRIQRFMRTCKQKDVDWAISSDKYGIWHKNIKKSWYEKSPNSVTEEEFNKLVDDFNRKLKDFDEIWFFYNPGKFHKSYRKLIRKKTLGKNNVYDWFESNQKTKKEKLIQFSDNFYENYLKILGNY